MNLPDIKSVNIHFPTGRSTYTVGEELDGERISSIKHLVENGTTSVALMNARQRPIKVIFSPYISLKF